MCGNIVDDTGFEADMGVDEDGTAEDGVHSWVQRAGGERGNRERYDRDGQQSLKSPVVGAVGWVGRWCYCWIVC